MTACPKPSMAGKKRKSKKSLSQLIKDADRIFSKFIRNRDAVKLNGRCCTCGAPGNQAGHFVKRSHKKIRWHPINVHLQCVRCNHYLDGNEAEYAKFIINQYGLTMFQWLMDQKGTYKPTREELEKIIEAYK